MKRRLVLLAIMACCLAGCVRLGFAAANWPFLVSSAEIVKDVFYAPAPSLKLDIYKPRQKSGKPHDVVVFLYGGRWQDGNKKDYAFVGETFADRGFIVVIPDYRKYPSVKFPTFVEDAAAALAWTHAHIGQYGGNPARIHVAGHSAGAHIGSLVVADTRYLEAHGKKPREIIKSFIGLAGPYSFTPAEPDLIDMFGPPEKFPDMQATHFISGHEPPMFLLHGLKDDLVHMDNLEKLEASVLAKGGSVETKTYENVDHMWIVRALTWLGHNKPDIATDMEKFMKARP